MLEQSFARRRVVRLAKVRGRWRGPPDTRAYCIAGLEKQLPCTKDPGHEFGTLVDARGSPHGRRQRDMTVFVDTKQFGCDAQG